MCRKVVVLEHVAYSRTVSMAPAEDTETIAISQQSILVGLNFGNHMLTTCVQDKSGSGDASLS